MVDWSRYEVAGHRMTQHAASRMVEMGVTLEQLVEALTRPDVSYEQQGYGPGAMVHKRGPISVATGEDEKGKVIKSVLWNTQERYER